MNTQYLPIGEREISEIKRGMWFDESKKRHVKFGVGREKVWREASSVSLHIDLFFPTYVHLSLFGFWIFYLMLERHGIDLCILGIRLFFRWSTWSDNRTRQEVKRNVWKKVSFNDDELYLNVSQNNCNAYDFQKGVGYVGYFKIESNLDDVLPEIIRRRDSYLDAIKSMA